MKEALTGLRLRLGSAKKWDSRRGGGLPSGSSLLSWGSKASGRGCIPVTRMPEGIMEIPVCFYFFPPSEHLQT